MPPKSKSSKPKPTTQPNSPKSEPPKPNWPPLRPLLPAADLALTCLLPDQIYLINNFLTSTLCKTYVSFFSSLPLTTTPGKPKRGDAVRVNDRFQIEDRRFAEALWEATALRELVLDFEEEEEEEEDEDGGNGERKRTRTMKEIWGGEPLGLNPNIRIYRYSRGQFFARHCMFSPTILPVVGGIGLTSNIRRRLQHSNLLFGFKSTATGQNNMDATRLSLYMSGRRNGFLPRSHTGEPQPGTCVCGSGDGAGVAASAWRAVSHARGNGGDRGREVGFEERFGCFSLMERYHNAFNKTADSYNYQTRLAERNFLCLTFETRDESNQAK